MRTIVYIIAIIVLCLVASCSDWMEIKPKGKVILSKVDDYDLLLRQNIELGSSVGWTVSYGNELYMTDDISLPENVYASQIDESNRNAYIWADHIYLEAEEDRDWSSLYNQIYIANTIIDEVLGSAGSETLKKQLYAEAKVQRAFAYLCLVNLYAKQYNAVTCAADLGVPLITKPLLGGSLKRASVKDVYELIISDLSEETILNLKNNQDNSYRVSKAAAYALLSRVNLYMGNYTGALENATKSLDLYRFMYDYNTIGRNAWLPDLLNLPERYLNKEQILDKEPSVGYLLIYPSESLLKLYDVSNDLRYSGFYALEFIEPYSRMIYYQEYLVGRTYGLSVPEMILTQAECFARDNQVSKAMEAVNSIRKRRFKEAAYTPLSASSGDEALVIVKKERRIELAFKGLRWFDLKRYNAFDNANITLSHTAKGKTYTLAPNDNRWVLPIGRKYIQKNPEIEQNPR